MAKINGTLIAVLSGADKVLYATSATLNVKQNLPDVTNKESAGWAEHINGLRDWDISIDGKYDTAGEGLTPNEIMTAIIGRSADTVIKFVTNAGTNTVGWTGNGTFDTCTLGGPMEDGSTYSAHIKGNGALAAL
jgi:predicted secreted protein